MKSYIDAVAKARGDNKKEIEAHLNAAEAAKAEAAILREKKAKAIENGDQAEYLSLCNQIEYQEARAKREKEKAKVAELPTDTIMQLWEEYATEYNKVFEKKKASFDKIREELGKAYIDLLMVVAAGNNEWNSVKVNLRDRRVGARCADEIITQLSKPEDSKCGYASLSPEGSIAVTVLGLDGNRAENINFIENGGFIKSIYDESFNEALARKSKEKPKKPLFFYPVYLPETEEEKLQRKLRNDTEPPVGYIYV